MGFLGAQGGKEPGFDISYILGDRKVLDVQTFREEAIEEKKKGHIKGEGRDPRVILTFITFFLRVALAMTDPIFTKGQALSLPGSVTSTNLLATVNLRFLIQ